MRKALLIILFSYFPSLLFSQSNADFGSWVEIGATKVLPHRLQLGAEAELRLRDNSTAVDRMAIGGSLSYKANKYLKVGLVYNFIESHKDGKISKEEYDLDGDLIAYRLLPSYWRPRHRLSLDVNPSIKVGRWLRISLRERYQYTHQRAMSVGRYEYELEGGVWEREDYKAKTYDAEDSHILRSRIKLSVDKKRLAWSPYVSCERQHYLGKSMKLKRVRACAGTANKIHQRTSIGLAYVFTCDTDDDNLRRHALNLSYDIKF